MKTNSLQKQRKSHPKVLKLSLLIIDYFFFNLEYQTKPISCITTHYQIKTHNFHHNSSYKNPTKTTTSPTMLEQLHP
ncbi:hypothetical protein CDL12_21038 [Handroanthus impetiginosus]|uniref:Uncharacterized protein n=1 Tax=Handroanthus impetiginosus TaxID=429701 RepID=A0A2G9GMB8_9LAMI|nr:hypothetical protein CDL12_21038 [Handroanthus impetiginosus]